MKVFFSAGEASGDTHAASVAKALRAMHPDVTMLGMGGEKMAEAGVDIVYDIKNLGYIGIVEIVKAIPSFFRLRTYLRGILERERPDVFVCVDYPGFNMKMAAVAHELGIPVLYYIAPTIWAWHRSRGNTIKKYVTKVASIFPFEAKAYEEFNCDVTFVGHPLVDIVQTTMSRDEARAHFGVQADATKVLLMPGSRKQEVLGLLAPMLGGLSQWQQGKRVQVFLPRAHTIEREWLETVISEYDVPVTITEGHTYDLMSVCDVAVAASGTATLETALMGLPTLLVYRVAPLTYFLGKRLVQIPYVGLPNIVAGREVIPELLQDAVTPAAIAEELSAMMKPDRYQHIKEDLQAVKADLGAPGAVQRVASLIADLAQTEDLNG